MSIRIVLVGTTHPGNIGATARAMKNMGLADLVLVAPRSFPHEEATARASGAEDVLQRARVVASLEEAVADCIWVAGASARQRSLSWPELSAREAAEKAVALSGSGAVALVFGPEKSGLSNEDLARCQALVYIPTSPDFSSLNLAMAVQVVTYEVLVQHAATRQPPVRDVRPATSGEMENFYRHLEELLLAAGFLDPDNPRHLMKRLRRLFARAEPDMNEVNILRGILASLEPVRRDRDAG
ncbi:MAG: RNA methyltransferase [Gammaproteobacteria bacterium]